MVGARLEAIAQRRQILVQVLCLSRCGLALDSYGASLARAPIGFVQERPVDVMRERGQPAPDCFFSQGRYPVKFC